MSDIIKQSFQEAASRCATPPSDPPETVLCDRSRLDEIRDRVVRSRDLLRRDSFNGEPTTNTVVNFAYSILGECLHLLGEVEVDNRPISDPSSDPSYELLNALEKIVDLDDDAHPGLATWVQARQVAHQYAKAVIGRAKEGNPTVSIVSELVDACEALLEESSGEDSGGIRAAKAAIARAKGERT